MFKSIRLYDDTMIKQKKVYRHSLFNTDLMSDSEFVENSKKFFCNDFDHIDFYDFLRSITQGTKMLET